MLIPHYYQSSEQTCGPACLRMLFAALGAAADEATVAQRCGVTGLGCTVQDLVAGAQAFGFNAVLMPVRSEPDAIAALSQLAPFVAMIDLASVYNTLPMFQWHFVVPLGPSRRGKWCFTTRPTAPTGASRWTISFRAGRRPDTEEMRVWTP